MTAQPRRRKRRVLTLPSGSYRVVGVRRSATAAHRAAQAAGCRWTRDGGRFVLIEPAAMEGGQWR